LAKKRSTFAVCLGLLFLSAPAFARQSAQGWCQVGGQSVVTNGQTSQTKVQRSAPSCTVTVNVVGGGLATIFSDNAGTPLSNPFTAASNGQWQWYGDNGHYSVVTSGGSPALPSSVTYPDILLDDTAGTGFTYASIAFSATPVFNSASASYFVMTLTGNVTSSSVSGSPVGGSLIGFQLCQDGTGSRTFAWPGNFTRPPTISSIASSCTQASFVFDSASATWRNFAPPGDAFTSVLPTTCGANTFFTAIAEQGATCAQPSAAGLTNGVTGSGAVVLATSPTITTPAISGATLSGTSTFTGAITAGANAITGGAIIGTTGTFSGNVAVAGTFTAGSYTNNLSAFAATTSAQLAGVISDESGTGLLVFSSSPTLVTPNIGVATATSINKVAITTPATSATLTIANAKTLSVTNSLTLSGTDGTTQTFPSTSATLARTDAGQTFTGTQVFTSPTINGTPTGTGIPTFTLKKGSGAGNYTSASTTYVVMDAANLCYTVTIPTGWKLQAIASFTIGSLTAAINVLAAITDNAACSTANAGILQETSITPPATGAGVSGTLGYIITGDGAAHNIALQFRTTNAADSVFISNGTATLTPTIVLTLSPSN